MTLGRPVIRQRPLISMDVSCSLGNTQPISIFSQLGGALAHQHVVLAAHILDDGLVELVAGHLNGGGLHHAAQGDDGDVAGAAADVHYHVAVGLGNVDARADGRGHRLLDEVHAAGAGLNARIDHGALLYLGDAGGDADDDTGLEQLEAAGDLVQELA